jgi:hypothetical protein
MLPPFDGANVGRHLDNQLVARLDPSILALLDPHLRIVHLDQGDVISETHSTVAKVYFPHNGIISCVVELVGGGAIETGMIGKDGQFRLDEMASPTRKST